MAPGSRDKRPGPTAALRAIGGGERSISSHYERHCNRICISQALLVQAAAFTSIFLCCSTAFAVFGMVMVSTPFEKFATILS